jgi:tRNA nucleotidyltransferase (CCA-adding enzyme)
MINNIYQKVKEIIEPVYLVGGCLRDKLLNITPKDYDFTTPVTPDEIEQRIKQSGRRAYLTGKRFGTLGLKIDGQFVEITTFRTEKYISGSRKPEVDFVKDITADLSRRDFTINAIAFRNNKYIDPFKGIDDINNKIIRCVGKANERFKEDPLRMLRVARFASQLDFTIEENTEKQTKQFAHKILEVSRERWVLEMDKLLMTSVPSIGLDFLARTKLLNFMFPELSLQVNYNQNSPYHDLELWEHTKIVVDNTPADINIRWASLLHDIAKPFVRTDKENRSNYIKHDLLGAEIVEKIARYLKWSNDRRECVKNLVLNHLKDDSPLRQADFIGKKKNKGE